MRTVQVAFIRGRGCLIDGAVVTDSQLVTGGLNGPWTFRTPRSAWRVLATVISGGGGGGGGTGNPLTTGNTNRGAGGGGGASSGYFGVEVPLCRGLPMTVVVGAGGAGGAAGGAADVTHPTTRGASVAAGNGGNGGQSSIAVGGDGHFLLSCVATGGMGAHWGTSDPGGTFHGVGGIVAPPPGGGLGATASRLSEAAGATGRAAISFARTLVSQADTHAGLTPHLWAAPAFNSEAFAYHETGSSGALAGGNGGGRMATPHRQLVQEFEGAAGANMAFVNRDQWRGDNPGRALLDISTGAFGFGHGGAGGRSARRFDGPPVVETWPAPGQAGAPGIVILELFF